MLLHTQRAIEDSVNILMPRVVEQVMQTRDSYFQQLSSSEKLSLNITSNVLWSVLKRYIKLICLKRV